MTDLGWDIPGVPRDVRPGSDALLTADGPASPRGHSESRRQARTQCGATAKSSRPKASASAFAGSSTGAFARPSDGAWTARSSPSTGTVPSPSVSSSSSSSSSSGSASAGSGPAGPVPDSPAEALALLDAALAYLARASVASWPDGQQADCLRALAVAESRQAAAHARVLAAFSVPGGGLAGDGHRSPRMWLTWQTQATRRAASAHVGWMRRLADHPVIAAALADGQVSVSWARQICEWTDQLPEDVRAGADQALLHAAVRGIGLAGLADMVAELIRQHASQDADDGGFEDRMVRLATTFDGAGRLEGDLTARCAGAVEAVLDSLSAVRGPEDSRTLAQRRHDALEEACTRLIAADGLPERAGQPVRLELSITLDQVAAGGVGSPAGPGATCDTAILPMVTGHLDHDLLARLAQAECREDHTAAATGQAGDDQHGLVLAQAIALLSGPSGHAAALRRQLTGIPAAAISLPLDIAATLDTIPVHLRRAVKKRDQHCRFPGCDMPPAGCDVHHVIHRKDGGRHALTNLTLLCRFHHLIAIHRWGWQITLNPDGTTTAVSPDGQRTLHSHAPPNAA
jgi:Domain of unknown function (DUF222)/HNH endonuclease